MRRTTDIARKATECSQSQKNAAPAKDCHHKPMSALLAVRNNYQNDRAVNLA